MLHKYIYLEKNALFSYIQPKIKKNHIVVSYNIENFKKKMSYHAFSVIITSSLKSRELGQYLKNKKIFCFHLVSRITILYVRHTLDIK